MNIKKTNNLYENWVKKPEMETIVSIMNEIDMFHKNKGLIYIFMIDKIYNHIMKHFDLLTVDHNQKKFYKNMLSKIYHSLYQIYQIHDYKIYNYGIYYYYYQYQVNDLLNSLIDYDIYDEYLSIESFFRGIHQIIEINLLYLMDNQDIIEGNINIDHEYTKTFIYKNIYVWDELIQLLHLLSSMDEYQYQKYRNLIYGTSGGESINLRKIQRRIQNVDQLFTKDIQKIIMNNDEQKYLVSAIKLYQYYSTQFWLTHFNLAASTNGIKNKGTKETPILKLVDRCITMTDTRINNAIFEVSKIVTNDRYKKKVKIDDKEKSIGISVYNSSKEIFDN